MPDYNYGNEVSGKIYHLIFFVHRPFPSHELRVLTVMMDRIIRTLLGLSKGLVSVAAT